MVQKAQNPRERFETAAYELFSERGYLETTVPEIASKAGLTQRTFYRYLTDKREVMFWRAEAHQAAITRAIIKLPEGLHPLQTVAAGFEAVAPFIDSRRAIVKQRQVLISTYIELHERELMKLHMLGLAISSALQERGMQPALSRMVAEISVALWKVALQNWSDDEAHTGFVSHVQAAVKEFKAGLGRVTG